jgi:hypothetical protein
MDQKLAVHAISTAQWLLGGELPGPFLHWISAKSPMHSLSAPKPSEVQSSEF